jgi:DNA modification methylase
VQRSEIGLWAVKKRTKTAKWVFNRDAAKSFEDGVFRYGVPRARKDRPRHQSKKPDGLFMEIIRILSNPGDLVLDPFAGGGTTAYAAEMEGRRHISIEASEEWVAEARAHWMDAMERPVKA